MADVEKGGGSEQTGNLFKEGFNMQLKSPPTINLVSVRKGKG